MATLTRNVNNHVMGANGWEPQTGAGGGGGGSYVLPPATAETLGGIKVGDGLSVEEDGTLSVEGGSGDEFTVIDATEYFTDGVLYISSYLTSSDFKNAIIAANTAGKPVVIKNLTVKAATSSAKASLVAPYTIVNIDTASSSTYIYVGSFIQQNEFLLQIRIQLSNNRVQMISLDILNKATTTQYGVVKVGAGLRVINGTIKTGPEKRVDFTENVFDIMSNGAEINPIVVEWAIDAGLYNIAYVESVAFDHICFNQIDYDRIDTVVSYSQEQTEYEGEQGVMETWDILFLPLLPDYTTTSKLCAFKATLNKFSGSGDSIYFGTGYQAVVLQ